MKLELYDINKSVLFYIPEKGEIKPNGNTKYNQAIGIIKSYEINSPEDIIVEIEIESFFSKDLKFVRIPYSDIIFVNKETTLYKEILLKDLENEETTVIETECTNYKDTCIICINISEKCFMVSNSFTSNNGDNYNAGDLLYCKRREDSEEAYFVNDYFDIAFSVDDYLSMRYPIIQVNAKLETLLENLEKEKSSFLKTINN